MSEPSLTPERDSLWSKHQGLTPSLAVDMIQLAGKLEIERDEARRLCRWAFPRLRSMCHDFDGGATGWACADQMDEHPKIFENASLSHGDESEH